MLITVSHSQAQWIRTSGPKPGRTTGIVGGHVLSLVRSDSNLFAGTAYGVYRSTDDGDSWIQVDTGFSQTYVMTLCLSGANLLAGTIGGAYRSADNGESWIPVDSGLPKSQIDAFV